MVVEYFYGSFQGYLYEVLGMLSWLCLTSCTIVVNVKCHIFYANNPQSSECCVELNGLMPYLRHYWQNMTKLHQMGLPLNFLNLSILGCTHLLLRMRELLLYDKVKMLHTGYKLKSINWVGKLMPSLYTPLI